MPRYNIKYYFEQYSLFWLKLWLMSSGRVKSQNLVYKKSTKSINNPINKQLKARHEKQHYNSSQTHFQFEELDASRHDKKKSAQTEYIKKKKKKVQPWKESAWAPPHCCLLWSLPFYNDLHLFMLSLINTINIVCH